MASEAQRLIGISLSKIAQSRSHRGGVSLHKNLLVATVLQKARYIFMEEAYNMVHYQPAVPSPAHHPAAEQQSHRPQEAEEDLAVGLTPEEAAADAVADAPTTCAKCQDKENHPPSFHASSTEVTYLDLDKNSSGVVLRERSNSTLSLKRRRAIAEWETEEAVQSILPKRSRPEAEDADDDSVFLDDAATLLSDAVSKEIEEDASSSMEIDRITSLVSIFSFSMGDGKLNRSVSAPDLCSAQAKDAQESIQQRQFLAMTV